MLRILLLMNLLRDSVDTSAKYFVWYDKIKNYEGIV